LDASAKFHSVQRSVVSKFDVLNVTVCLVSGLEPSWRLLW
jgi:hypothetical protein